MACRPRAIVGWGLQTGLLRPLFIVLAASLELRESSSGDFPLRPRGVKGRKHGASSLGRLHRWARGTEAETRCHRLTSWLPRRPPESETRGAGPVSREVRTGGASELPAVPASGEPGGRGSESAPG